MLSALRYYWIAAKGYRLRPWKSPYIRWRMETFFGEQAAALDARAFFRLLWRERARVWGGFLILLGSLISLNEPGYVHFGFVDVWRPLVIVNLHRFFRYRPLDFRIPVIKWQTVSDLREQPKA